ncbi:MAG: hypothetical protein JHC98_07825 [Thermoleophilaceae bacterium]|nr:hypothetical protein [Thermoleophilaceae bacterium]
MNRQSSPRQLNYSNALLIVGLVLSLFVVMFRPAGADAVLPKSVSVYDTPDAEQGGSSGSLKLSDVPTRSNITYKILPQGQKDKKKAVEVGLTGKSLIEILAKGGVKTENVQFVRVRYGATADDGVMRLVPLGDPNAERPPILLESGKLPGFGPLKTPSIVPGQPNLDDPISQDSFVPTGDARLTFIPGEAGAKIFRVRINSKKRKSGEYTLTATVNGAPKGILEYTWYTYDAKNNPVRVATSGNSIETKDATTGSAQHVVTVVVKERTTGSYGQSGIEYTSRKKSKGTTKNPYEPTPKTGGNTGTGTGTGTGVGTGTGTGTNTLGGGNLSTVPDQTGVTPLPQDTTPTDQTTSPTPPTAATSSAVDTTAITNAAQNVSGTGGLKTVSGVLLSAPTVAPASAAGGTQISALPAPVADQLNSIFQPVDDVDDAWAYLLALLFAFTFSGAVREWVKP